MAESTSEGLDKLRPLIEAKNWDGALTLLDSLMKKAGPDSYDMAFLSDTVGKIYLQKGEYSKAVAPMETALRLSEQHPHFFKPNVVQDMTYFLAQIYYQDVASSKNPAIQQQGFAKATSYLEQWLKKSTKPDSDPAQQEAVLFHASLLYNQAAFDPAKPDQDALKRCEAEVERGLRMSAHPKENLYAILLAICQLRNDYPRAAEILELLLKQSPTKKEYWPQLAGVYLNLAASEKDERRSRELNIRGILAIERAQALGFMKSPKENYNLVGVYFNVGQFGRATELLYAGLKNGSIDNEPKNWELLAYSYQQIDRPTQAIDVLKEATQRFPTLGQFDYQIAQIYYGINKVEDTYTFLKSAVKKGHLEKPGTVYAFLAYSSFELSKYDEALEAVNKALGLPEAKSDKQLPLLKQGIEDAIKDREAKKAAMETRA